MTDFEKILSALENQKESAVSKDGYRRITPDVTTGLDEIEVICRSVMIGFSFTAKGRFRGIYNWQ